MLMAFEFYFIFFSFNWSFWYFFHFFRLIVSVNLTAAFCVKCFSFEKCLIVWWITHHLRNICAKWSHWKAKQFGLWSGAWHNPLFHFYWFYSHICPIVHMYICISIVQRFSAMRDKWVNRVPCTSISLLNYFKKNKVSFEDGKWDSSFFLLFMNINANFSTFETRIQ